MSLIILVLRIVYGEARYAMKPFSHGMLISPMNNHK